MNRWRVVAALGVLLAGTGITHAQTVPAPTVMLGAPVITPITPPAPPVVFGTPVPVTTAQQPLPKGPAQPPLTPVVPMPMLLPLQKDAVQAPSAPMPAPLPAPLAAPLAAPLTTNRVIDMPPVPPQSSAVVPGSGNSYRPWVQVDYLLWWARGGPTGGPLVTTGSPTDAVPGALGQPNTRVLLGDAPLGYGTISGLRISGGIPLSDGLSFEGSYFDLEQRSFGFTANSNGAGTPLIARPVINAQTGMQSSYVDSFAGFLAGGINVNAQLQLDGYDFNLAANLLSTPALRFDVLGGFRALNLSESLSMRDQLYPLAPGFLMFDGVPLPLTSQVTDFDAFHTSNHFYGGQIGGRFGWQDGSFSVNAVVKVALGATQQLVDITGGSTRFMLGASPLSVPGGILAQPSNIGHYYRSAFSVVPETGLEFGYQITPRLRATVGYTFMYWTNVARPGNQTDRTVNPAQVPTDPGFGIGGGPARPALPSVRDSDFWVQGVNFGLLFAF